MTHQTEASSKLHFENLSKKDMNFDDIFYHIKDFMRKEPNANYRLMIGTDSQVHHLYTTFITGVIIHRVGKGAWACFREIEHSREYLNLKEKISMETSLTEEVAFEFSRNHKDELIGIVLPHVYSGAAFEMEGHIDVGKEKQNLTRHLVQEMVSRIESVGLKPKIKPDSLAASGYANRYTK